MNFSIRIRSLLTPEVTLHESFIASLLGSLVLINFMISFIDEIAILFIPLFLSSCSYDPSPFVSGSDDCYVCKMGLADFRFGGEFITKKGKTFKFDDLGCMIEYLESGSIEKKDIARILVMNFESPNHFVDAEKAWIIVSPELKSPMKSNAAGFETKEAAEIILKQKNGTLLNWSDLIKNLTHS